MSFGTFLLVCLAIYLWWPRKIKKPEVGEFWIYKRTNCCEDLKVEIFEVKDGWVKYGTNKECPVMIEVEEFTRIYMGWSKK